MAKLRLDLALVERRLAESRSKAQAYIMAGLVYAGEKKLDKAGLEISEDLEITVRGKEHPWVSRGGMKLAKGLKEFGLDVSGMVAMDVGSSTGGFTDVLLTNGAAKVYAVDVGTGQLDPKIRHDARVVVMEQTNARHLTAEMLQAAESGSQESSPPAGGGSEGREAVRPFAQKPTSTRQPETMSHAEHLRKNPSEAEKQLWTALRAGQLGVKFRRQQSIGNFIVDFVSMEQKLVIELDGGQHGHALSYDQKRTEWLQQAGYQVVRYWNHDVLENKDGVVADILTRLAQDARAFPPPNLPPPAGGGMMVAGDLPPPVGGEMMVAGEGMLDLVVCDASFISLKKVLPAALALTKPTARLLTLIKPQFEVGKAEVSRGKGVIRDAALHDMVCSDISAWITGEGWHVVGIAESPITGPKGNKEFLLYATKGMA